MRTMAIRGGCRSFFEGTTYRFQLDLDTRFNRSDIAFDDAVVCRQAAVRCYVEKADGRIGGKQLVDAIAQQFGLIRGQA